MRKTPTLLLALLIGCSSHLPPSKVLNAPPAMQSAPGTFTLSPANTQIKFVGSALLISHEGTFARFTGSVVAPLQPGSPHEVNFEAARISADIEMDSVQTEYPLLTKHLKDADFFDVKSYPAARFVSTRIDHATAGDADHIIVGNLTLHGITKAIEMPAHFAKAADTITITATVTLKQSDFKMKSSQTTTDEVPVTIVVRLSTK